MPARSRIPSLELDAYVVDTLMPDLVGHDRSPSAFLVYLFLCRQARRAASEVELSLGQIAEGTGISKRSVQSALSLLERRRLVAVTRSDPGFVSAYAVKSPWRR